MSKNAQPEALATFAKASRNDGKKPEELGLTADKGTEPIPTSSKTKDRAATKVLQEGVTHQDKGSRQVIDKLPDRIIESRTNEDLDNRAEPDNPTTLQSSDTRGGFEGQGDRRKP